MILELVIAYMLGVLTPVAIGLFMARRMKSRLSKRITTASRRPEPTPPLRVVVDDDLDFGYELRPELTD